MYDEVYPRLSHSKSLTRPFLKQAKSHPERPKCSQKDIQRNRFVHDGSWCVKRHDVGTDDLH
jgi:hypothetical protein